MLKQMIAMGVVAAAVAAQAEPTLWLVGDSTVCNYSEKAAPQMGWGQPLPGLCKAGVKVANHAVGGRSTKSFIDEKRWEKVLGGLRPGDFVMIQFGHNDQKTDAERHTDPANTYRDYLKRYIAEAKAKGANPVLVTSVARRIFKDGKLQNSLGQYPAAMREVAKETGTPLIDLNAISTAKFSELGEKGTLDVFLHLPKGKYPSAPEGKQDNSHFQEGGAKLIAGWIVDDAKKQQLPLAALFK